MEEARSVLERLGRIETMRRANAGPAELLQELRCLLHEAQTWADEEGGEAGATAVDRLRTALEPGDGDGDPGRPQPQRDAHGRPFDATPARGRVGSGVAR
jgi:hypothetical protein